MKIFLIMIIIIFITSCTITDNNQDWHQILGTTYGWEIKNNGLEVLLDARVGDLKIRHVKTVDNDCASGYIHHIEMSGAIGPDSTVAMEKIMQTLPDCLNQKGEIIKTVSIYMNSGGGLLKDGYAMGKLFRKYAASNTVVTGGQQCSSSCAIAFLGGRYRSMSYDSQLLFHAPYLNISDKSIDCSDRGQVRELKEYYAFALNQQDGDFLHRRTMDYCSVSSGWILNADGAKLFGVTNL
jgi:ATP-dependent protease ClpP protease subunit